MLTVVLNQLRRQVDFIRGNRPKLKYFKDVFTVCFQRGSIGCFSRKAFPRGGIDVIDDQVHIPLGKEREACAFGQNHPEHGVGIFNTPFLTAAHRVAEIDV